MKKALAYKSISQIIFTGVTALLMGIISFVFAEYYAFDFEIIPRQIIFIIVASGIISLFSVIFLLYLLTLPKVLMYQDEHGVYIVKKSSELFIEYSALERVHTTISVWAKPFLVYTSLVLTLPNKTYIIRNIKDMPDVRDQIMQEAFYKDKSKFVD